MSDINLYMSFSEESLNDTKEGARDEAVDAYGEEDAGDNLVYPNCNLEIGEMYVDKSDGTIEINGDAFSGGKKLGYISLSIPFKDLAQDIIDNYINKLEKVKEVMKAIE